MTTTFLRISKHGKSRIKSMLSYWSYKKKQTQNRKKYSLFLRKLKDKKRRFQKTNVKSMTLVVKLLSKSRKLSKNKRVSRNVTPGAGLDTVWICILVALKKESEIKNKSTNPTTEAAEKEAVEKSVLPSGRQANRTKELNDPGLKC